MCVTMPGRVVAVDPDGATVQMSGRVRRASTLLHPEVEVGEWVIVAAGAIIERLDEADAALMRQALLGASLPAMFSERATGGSDGIDP